MTVIDYHGSRLVADDRRDVVWQSLWRYRYAFREYFDDFDHGSVYSHISLPDYLIANGYSVFLVEPRFMPLSVKGPLPVRPFLIRGLASRPDQAGWQADARTRPAETLN